MARSRIGLMGGSFNPIHRRHLQIASYALEEMKLGGVLFIPNGNPPHKHAELASAEHRFEMTRLAVIPYEKFTASGIEMNRPGVVYAADTLKLLHKQLPDADFFYIIGEDTLFELENWYQPLEVFRQCSFVVCMRQRQSVAEHPFVQGLKAKGAIIHFLSLEPQDISASDIRRQIAHGTIDDALLPPEVQEYIRVMRLYGSNASPDGAGTAYGHLKENLSDERLLHTLAVAYTANRLAREHNLDVPACELAGLLHDCAKCMNLQTLQKLARDAGLQLSDTEMNSPGLLHGPVGAVVAEQEYGIRRRDILTAIATHTTGYAGMTEFDAAIFLADKIEPYRFDIPALEEIRKTAYRDLYKATYLMLLDSREHVSQTNRPLHPATDETIRWIQNQINQS